MAPTITDPPIAKTPGGSESVLSPTDTTLSGVEVVEDTDGRELWAPASKYTLAVRKQQRWEGLYVFALILSSLGACIVWSAGFAQLVCAQLQLTTLAGDVVARCLLLSAAGLLGGTVYAAKWLYHAVAKGLWHEDRRLWRFLSPWISMGTAFGVGTLLQAGIFRGAGPSSPAWGNSYLLAVGFLIGYFADKALAKMKDVTEVLFGETRERFGRKPPDID